MELSREEIEIIATFREKKEMERKERRKNNVMKAVKKHRQTEKYKQKNRLRMDRKRKWYRDFKDSIIKCANCNGKFPKECIDLHHVEEKEKPTSSLWFNKQKFIKEARKCVQLCANCHRMITNGIISDNELDNSWLQEQLDELEALDC